MKTNGETRARPEVAPVAENGFPLPPRGPDIDERRGWLANRTATRLDNVGQYSYAPDAVRGNCENAVGAAQVPLGIAGPLQVNGEHAQGIYYVPLATTEGALVRSYERGMMVISRSGGATTRVVVDENCIVPVFCFDTLDASCRFFHSVQGLFGELRSAAEQTTRHGKLLRIEPRIVGRDVYLRFCYHTADAHGMNMIMAATEAACRRLMECTDATRYYITTGLCSEKRAGSAALAGGKGKTVISEAVISRKLLRTYTRAAPADIVDMWRRTLVGQVAGGTHGYYGQTPNALTALFIACGQDVANVVNSAASITLFDETAAGSLYVSVTLSSLTVATVGGGTQLPTSRECLQMLGCYGAGRALRLAEIAAATVLAGELSMGAAIDTGEMSRAHERYGRNRPAPEPVAVKGSSFATGATTT